ncbi:linear amide C-N hydrolase [Planctomycetota bacterium]
MTKPLLIIALLSLNAFPAHACTCFVLETDDGLFFGRNYDWHLDQGLIVVNKRHLQKTAVFRGREDKAAQWTAQYGSVTFNQYGREFPLGGINEAGLVVEVMWLETTEYPPVDSRPAVMELQWVQYHLDTCASVAEVLATDEHLRITMDTQAPLHFLVCDDKGAVATIEFIKGKRVVHTGNKLSVPVLANSPYRPSQRYIKRLKPWGGTQALDRQSRSSLDRFACAAQCVQDYSQQKKTRPLDYAFNTLEAVNAGEATKFRIVYEATQKKISYTTYQHPQRRHLNLADCDFDPQTPTQILQINTPHNGDLKEHLFAYDLEINRKLILHTCRHTEITQNIPMAKLNELAAYPETLKAVASD